MIRLDQISKQHGQQILFLEASMSVFRGEKIGLVGPNGSGKSTVFRLIVREDQPDAGSVVIEKGLTIGYFSQDVGEMKGRTVVEEAMAGAGELSSLLHELRELEAKMADPAQAESLEATIERFGEVQARFDERGGYAFEAKAREILAGLGFHPESEWLRSRGHHTGARRRSRAPRESLPLPLAPPAGRPTPAPVVPTKWPWS